MEKKKKYLILKNKKDEKILKFFQQQHPYHLVNNSPWPLFLSFSVLFLALSLILYLHNFNDGKFFLIFSFFFLCFFLICWFRDIVRESTFEGQHTQKVQYGIKLGMILFIISEIMFFFAFFWAFFHSSLVPTIWINNIWPPKGIEIFNPWKIPLENTLILLLSGVSVTWSHKSFLYNNNIFETFLSLSYTIFLGIFFTLFQLFEYMTAFFNISDSIYGSIFYLATGFHGFHVIIGTIFLIVCWFRLIRNHFLKDQHIGFEAAIWYWHFVDMVWLFLYFFIYIWGAN